MRSDDIIYLSKYARDHDLLDDPGWKKLFRYVKNTKNMKCLLKDAKDKQCRNTFKIKFGMNIPCDHKETMVFDTDNGNTNFKDANILELKQIYNFYPFNSLGPTTSACIPPGHTKIQVHLIYDYNQDGRYKACMVVSCKMNGPNLDTYYYSVISLRSMRTVVLLDDLNDIEICTGDIRNTYLNSRTT